jgi:isoamyl acetate esterase
MNEGPLQADVVLRGYSGYNTRWALHLLDKVFPDNDLPPPKLVVVFFGANDAALPDHTR